MQLAVAREHLRGEGLVQLDQVDVADLQPGGGESLRHRLGRPHAHHRRIHAGDSEGDETGQRLAASSPEKHARLRLFSLSTRRYLRRRTWRYFRQLGKVQPDRFSGGLRLNVQQVWDLTAARCRFGKYLRVEVNGSVPPVAEVLRDFPSRRSQTEHGEIQEGLRVRLQLQRREAIGELDLGDAVRFYPSDGALERWQTGSHGPIAIVYE